MRYFLRILWWRIRGYPMMLLFEKNGSAHIRKATLKEEWHYTKNENIPNT